MADKRKKKQTVKTTKTVAKRTSSAKKTEKPVKAKAKAKAKQPAAKKSTPKKTTAKAKPAVKQTRKAVKTTAAKKSTKNVRVLKPDKDYENSTGGEKQIIVINSKKEQKKPIRGRKKLQRVANIGGYTAWDGRTGKTFATEKEAREYAIDFFARTGEIIAVTHTQRTVSHTFKAENKTDK